MKAKFLSVLLALTMVLSLLPTAVLAADGDENGENYVAAIGDDKYTSLQDAIEAAEDGATIKILKNYSDSNYALVTEKSLTIDLNDCSIQGPISKAWLYVEKAGNVTLTGDGSVTAMYAASVSGNTIPGGNAVNSTLTIENGTFTGTESGILYRGNGAKVVVNNGTISGGDNAAIMGNGTLDSSNDSGHTELIINNGTIVGNTATTSANGSYHYRNCGLYLPQSGTATINGGTIKGTNGAAIVIRSGSLTINDGIFEGHGSTDNYNCRMGDANPTYCGGLEIGYSCNYPGGMGNIVIKGGSFSSETSDALKSIGTAEDCTVAASKGSTITVTGGTFNTDVTAYLTSDYIQAKDGTVEKLGETNSVAKIGDTYFTSLSAAIDAATSGDTVTLLKDTPTDMITIAADKAIVLDTNGKTVTNSTGNYAINNNGTLTINGGGKIIRENAGNSAIRTIGKLTLENVTIETSDQMISVKVDENGVGTKGTLIVNDDTVLNAKNGQAIQSWGDVTINGGTMNGDVTAWSVKDWNPGDIIIKGGTINGDVIAYQRFRNNTYPDAPAKISIENGKVSGALTLAYVEFTGGTIVDLDKTSFPVSGSISITGGHFTSDPTAYKAEGLSVVASDVSGYTYTLKATTETSDTDVVVTDAVASSVSDDTTKIPAADAASISDVINKAVVENVAESLTDDAKAELINKAGASTALESGDTVTIVVNVAVKAVASDLSNTNNATLTFEADPTAIVYVNGEKKGDAQNVTNDMLNGSITVKLPLPAGFTPKQIAHKSDGYRTEYYLDHYERGAKHFTIDKNNCAVFDITHFSTFVLSGTQTYVAPSRPSTSTGSTITVGKTENGTITVSPATASKGTNVTITAKPADGYELGSLTATDANGSTLALTDLGNGKYSFTMPDGKVEVSGTFVKKSAQTFVDVPENAYYAPAVAWAVEKGVTEGTSATTFSPDAVCTRAQIVTFLYRAAGSPAVKSAVNPFTDVNASDYYYNAVLWAVENGITTGTTATTFSPNESCTRAQCAAFLYRYEQSQGKGFVGEWMFQLPFTDVPAWCYESVAWCYMNGVTEGTSATTFSPDDACTRAQIVTFLYRAAQVK